MSSRILTLAIAAFLALPSALLAQPAARPLLYLTVFRNPSTGLELRAGRIGVHLGFYPTILKADGEVEGRNTNFIRVGATFYSSADRTSLYVSPSLVVSLDDRFRNGIFADVGVRGRFSRSVAGRLGVGALRTVDGEVRVNPTVGLDVRLGGAR